MVEDSATLSPTQRAGQEATPEPDERSEHWVSELVSPCKVWGSPGSADSGQQCYIHYTWVELSSTTKMATNHSFCE